MRFSAPAATGTVAGIGGVAVASAPGSGGAVKPGSTKSPPAVPLHRFLIAWVQPGPNPRTAVSQSPMTYLRKSASATVALMAAVLGGAELKDSPGVVAQPFRLIGLTGGIIILSVHVFVSVFLRVVLSRNGR